MKLISYTHDNRASWGVVVEGGVVDARRIPSQPHQTIRDMLQANGLSGLKDLIEGRPADYRLEDIQYLPVIPNPEKILCVGLNYEEHRIESNRQPTGQPTIFVRFPSSQTGHLQRMVCPAESSIFDYEGEIAVIIGTAGRRIAESDAWDHIAGYSAYNDGSIRDWQHQTTQWTAGKNFEQTGAFGPCMVTRDELVDGEELTLITRLNGREMQRATTAMMIFSIPRLINYISTFTTLVPGDVIVTGTPGGVGIKRNPPVLMQPGDTVEIEVTKVGTLRNPVAEE
jgi:2-keto-4-pentenoate hydratase/2-oxohepta-3-ene-1,7-dioic acid hydratase in catechol pathway